MKKLKLNFVLYTDNLDGVKEYVKVNGEHIKLEEPLKLKMSGAYKHSFPCSLNQAMKSWECWKQILTFQRFYHSIFKKDSDCINAGTKFNILLLPIVYLYSLVDTRMFHKITFV